MIEVDRPGLLDTVQDKGRFGFERLGVNRSGAADPFALMAANILVGNQWDEASLEITLVGPSLLFRKDTVIAITGGDLSPRVNGIPIRMWESVFVHSGSLLQFSKKETGFRSYLAVAGGLDVPKVMGSKSTNIQSGFGGLEGRALRKGDILSFYDPPGNLKGIVGRVFPSPWRPNYSEAPMVRVILGPQDDFFTDEGIETFLSSNYRVETTSDRMGCRLSGPSVKFKSNTEMLSDGIPLGAIQVTPDGQPILLLADHQTVGGYPKIATVISADLPLAAQCVPGSSFIRFRSVSLVEAHTAYHKMYATLHQIRQIQD